MASFSLGSSHASIFYPNLLRSNGYYDQSSTMSEIRLICVTDISKYCETMQFTKKVDIILLFVNKLIKIIDFFLKNVVIIEILMESLNPNLILEPGKGE